MNHDDTPIDTRLRAALDHAPDAGAEPSAAVDRRILAAAREAVTPARRAPVAPWWQRLFDALMKPQTAAAFATLVLGTAIGLMWRGEVPPDAMPSPPVASPTSVEQPVPAPTALPAAPPALRDDAAVPAAVPAAAAEAPRAVGRVETPAKAATPPRAAPVVASPPAPTIAEKAAAPAAGPERAARDAAPAPAAAQPEIPAPAPPPMPTPAPLPVPTVGSTVPIPAPSIAPFPALSAPRSDGLAAGESRRAEAASRVARSAENTDAPAGPGLRLPRPADATLAVAVDDVDRVARGRWMPADASQAPGGGVRLIDAQGRALGRIVFEAEAVWWIPESGGRALRAALDPTQARALRSRVMPARAPEVDPTPPPR